GKALASQSVASSSFKASGERRIAQSGSTRFVGGFSSIAFASIMLLATATREGQRSEPARLPNLDPSFTGQGQAQRRAGPGLRSKARSRAVARAPPWRVVRANQRRSHPDEA